MMLIAAVLGSFVLGAVLTALVLGRRWKAAVDEARTELEGMAERYKEHEQENRELRQKNADLEYQVGSLKKDLNYERSRHQADPE
ncbi:MAG: hypothetical protein CSH37_04990 [Thalassolituus sp.]|uniref:Uncharacterized protein n=1 Tax=Thalassolituus maritimus TaxID=484498 RepID=A0ABP9ZW70_9GAMM|nr:hypothetical protein [Pseudomonadota bacterium]MEC8104658.1 hypothetical protein [Pseudomonadota bacterium]MEC8523048.1 hypothetical protein [Pseudomonadota bacterium]TNC86187.1 MAG: hypothetical protein CSH37_04990 [Thalassolituus sp.]|tara:strand:+ start:668 stop:922 length:255 start_codon:yes stop_codon:yes gene_type:complete